MAEKETIAFMIPAHIIIRALARQAEGKKIMLSYECGDRISGTWVCSNLDDAEGIALYFQNLRKSEKYPNSMAMLYDIREIRNEYYITLKNNAMLVCDKADYPDYEEGCILIDDDRIFEILEHMRASNFDRNKASGAIRKIRKDRKK